MKRSPRAAQSAPPDSHLPDAAAASIPAALRNFDTLPDSANVRVPVVAVLFACSVPTVWRRAKNGTLPPARKLSEGVTAWNVGELRKVLNGEVSQ